MEEDKQKIKERRVYLFFIYYSSLLTFGLLFMDWFSEFWFDKYGTMIFALITSLVFVFLLPSSAGAKHVK